MALDSFRVRETRKPKVEKFDLKEQMNSIFELKEMIDSLENDDIDQRWIKENESKEFTFTTPNQNDEDQELQEIQETMNRGISKLNSNERRNTLDDRQNVIQQSNQENNVQTSRENITPSQDDKAQLSRISELLGYQMRLTNSYGNTWFAQMTDEEKEQYIDLYTVAYNTTREDVESKIEDSIAKAYEEKISQNSLTSSNTRSR